MYLKLVLQTTLTCFGKNVPFSEGTFAKVTLLNPTSNFTYHKVFTIQKFNIVITWILCVLYGSRNKQHNFDECKIKRLGFINEVESVFCAVRMESFYNTDTFRL